MVSVVIRRCQLSFFTIGTLPDASKMRLAIKETHKRKEYYTSDVHWWLLRLSCWWLCGNKYAQVSAAKGAKLRGMYLIGPLSKATCVHSVWVPEFVTCSRLEGRYVRVIWYLSILLSEKLDHLSTILVTLASPFPIAYCHWEERIASNFLHMKKWNTRPPMVIWCRKSSYLKLHFLQRSYKHHPPYAIPGSVQADGWVIRQPKKPSNSMHIHPHCPSTTALPHTTNLSICLTHARWALMPLFCHCTFFWDSSFFLLFLCCNHTGTRAINPEMHPSSTMRGLYSWLTEVTSDSWSPALTANMWFGMHPTRVPAHDTIQWFRSHHFEPVLKPNWHAGYLNQSMSLLDLHYGDSVRI